MGRGIGVTFICVLLSSIFLGFIPSNVSWEKVKREVVKVREDKRQVEDKESSEKITVGRYVYRVALSNEDREKKNESIKVSSHVAVERQAKKEGHSILLRLVTGVVFLTILGLVSIVFYLKGKKGGGLDSRNAFSFLELVITLAIFTIVILAISFLLFSTSSFFTACEEKLTELNRARRLQLYLEKVLSMACEQGTDTVRIYSNEIVFPYCSVEDGKRVVVGYGKVRFNGSNIFIDKTGSGQEHLLAQNISSWQVVRDGDKIQMWYKFKNGGSYQFQVAVLTD